MDLFLNMNSSQPLYVTKKVKQDGAGALAIAGLSLAFAGVFAVQVKAWVDETHEKQDARASSRV